MDPREVFYENWEKEKDIENSCLPGGAEGLPEISQASLADSRKSHMLLAGHAMIHNLLLCEPYTAVCPRDKILKAFFAESSFKLSWKINLVFHRNLPCKPNIPVR